jgi:hypothetical protein
VLLSIDLDYPITRGDPESRLLAQSPLFVTPNPTNRQKIATKLDSDGKQITDQEYRLRVLLIGRKILPISIATGSDGKLNPD